MATLALSLLAATLVVAPTTAGAAVLCQGEPVTHNFSGRSSGVTQNFGSGRQVVLGSRYNDTFNMGDGSDIVCGGAGNDTINGGNGHDTILGQSGKDTINGAGGNDVLNGGGGDDVLNGGGWKDTIVGGDGDDTINGGDGDDNINGGNGHDDMRGDNGHDTIRAGFGADRVVGGNGNDTLHGEGGRDTMFGGPGDDTMNGGNGVDMITGGDGNDTIIGENGVDTLRGNDGDDDIYGGDGVDTIDGGNGEDKIVGGNDGDTLYGGPDRDTINGEGGADTIRGGGGDDVIDGGPGIDNIRGNAGSDVVTQGRDLDHPPQPVSCTATFLNDGQVRVAWTPISGQGQYQVVRGGSVVQTVTGRSFTHRPNDTTSRPTYIVRYYRDGAVDGTCSSIIEQAPAPQQGNNNPAPQPANDTPLAPPNTDSPAHNAPEPAPILGPVALPVICSTTPTFFPIHKGLLTPINASLTQISAEFSGDGCSLEKITVPGNTNIVVVGQNLTHWEIGIPNEPHFGTTLRAWIPKQIRDNLPSLPTNFSPTAGTPTNVVPVTYAEDPSGAISEAISTPDFKVHPRSSDRDTLYVNAVLDLPVASVREGFCAGSELSLQLRITYTRTGDDAVTLHDIKVKNRGDFPINIAIVHGSHIGADANGTAGFPGGDPLPSQDTQELFANLPFGQSFDYTYPFTEDSFIQFAWKETAGHLTENSNLCTATTTVHFRQ